MGDGSVQAWTVRDYGLPRARRRQRIRRNGGRKSAPMESWGSLARKKGWLQGEMVASQLTASWNQTLGWLKALKTAVVQ